MKKKLLTAVLTLVAVLCLCIGISACAGTNSDTSEEGTETEQPSGGHQGGEDS